MDDGRFVSLEKPFHNTETRTDLDISQPTGYIDVSFNLSLRRLDFQMTCCDPMCLSSCRTCLFLLAVKRIVPRG